MRVLQTVPLLRIFDVAKAREFYVDFPGFRVDWEHRFEPRAPLYMQVSRDTCVPHVMEVVDPFGNRLRFNEDVAPPAPGKDVRQ